MNIAWEGADLHFHELEFVQLSLQILLFIMHCMPCRAFHIVLFIIFIFNEEITVLKRERVKPKISLFKLLVLLYGDNNNQQKGPHCNILQTPYL